VKGKKTELTGKATEDTEELGHQVRGGFRPSVSSDGYVSSYFMETPR